MNKTRSNNSAVTAAQVRTSSIEAATRLDPATALQRALMPPMSYRPDPLQLEALQHAIGDRAVYQLLSQHTTVVTEPHDQTGLSNRPSSGSSMNRSTGRMTQRATHLVTDKLNVVGERHGKTDARLDEEKKFCAAKTKSGNYWERK
jgi:hypothetical protein